MTGGVWKGKGSTRAWKRVRAQVIARDLAQTTLEGRPNCRLAIPGVCVGDHGARHVHHVVGADSPNPLDPDLLITTCGPCNLHVGDPRDHSPAVPPPAWLSRRMKENP